MAHRNWIAALMAADSDPLIALVTRPETDAFHDADFFDRVVGSPSLEAARFIRLQRRLGFMVIELERMPIGDGLALSRCHVLSLSSVAEVAA